MAIQIPLDQFKFYPARKVLSMEYNKSSFPSELMVKSHHTGKEVRFVCVPEYDVLFDQDQWDGVQQIYRPVGNVPNVDYLVLTRG